MESKTRKALSTAGKILPLEASAKSSGQYQTHKIVSLDYNNTHRELVEKCKRGDRQAQFELYRLYSKAMYNVCLRMLRDESDAEDVLQNAFIDIFTKLSSSKFESSIGAWIKKVVVNNCINFLKKRRLQFTEIEEKHGHIISEEETPGDEYFGMNVESVKKALNSLPDGYRVVFSLYLLEGYDHQEIGEILGISEATSKSQYSRAKQKLKDLLNNQRQVSNY